MEMSCGFINAYFKNDVRILGMHSCQPAIPVAVSPVFMSKSAKTEHATGIKIWWT